jgi:hypothetical protein
VADGILEALRHRPRNYKTQSDVKESAKFFADVIRTNGANLRRSGARRAPVSVSGRAEARVRRYHLPSPLFTEPFMPAVLFKASAFAVGRGFDLAPAGLVARTGTAKFIE